MTLSDYDVFGRECPYTGICVRFDDRMNGIDQLFCFGDFERCAIYKSIKLEEDFKYQQRLDFEDEDDTSTWLHYIKTVIVQVKL